MKKILLSSVAFLGLTIGASAADLPRRAAPPVFAPIPVFTWTGFYVGVNAGYAWSDEDNWNGVAFAPVGTFAGAGGAFGTTSGTFNTLGAGGFAGNNGDNGGFTAGGTVGFNYQMGAIVVGLEGDLNWADIGGNNNNGFFGGAVAAAPFFTIATGPGLPAGAALASGGFSGSGIEWFGTIRGRLGVAFDRTLIFATGGFAFGSGGGNNNGFCGGIAFGGCGNNDDWRSGWTVGGGVEHAFTNNLTVKLEGLWVNLERDNNNFGGVFYNAANNTVFVGNANRKDDDFFVARVGINYKFGM